MAVVVVVATVVVVMLIVHLLFLRSVCEVSHELKPRTRNKGVNRWTKVLFPWFPGLCVVSSTSTKFFNRRLPSTVYRFTATTTHPLTHHHETAHVQTCKNPFRHRTCQSPRPNSSLSAHGWISGPQFHHTLHHHHHHHVPIAIAGQSQCHHGPQQQR